MWADVFTFCVQKAQKAHGSLLLRRTTDWKHKAIKLIPFTSSLIQIYTKCLSYSIYPVYRSHTTLRCRSVVVAASLASREQQSGYYSLQQAGLINNVLATDRRNTIIKVVWDKIEVSVTGDMEPTGGQVSWNNIKHTPFTYGPRHSVSLSIVRVKKNILRYRKLTWNRSSHHCSIPSSRKMRRWTGKAHSLFSLANVRIQG